MALSQTNFVLKSPPLAIDFRGTPQDFFEELASRLSIVSPSGVNFFIVSDIEPIENSGPWLNTSGTVGQWWVFDSATGRYIPSGISSSLPHFFFFQDANPGTPTAKQSTLWIRTNQNRIVGIYRWDGSAWQASANITHSGTTAQRPTSPIDLENYFDEDINVLLRFERGEWRTADGSPGDIKAVSHVTLTEAKRYNPGWELLGRDDESQRGRLLSSAAQDPGTSPESAFVTDSGITPQGAGEKKGSEIHILISVEHEPHTHELGHASSLGNGKQLELHRVDDGDTFPIPDPAPPNNWRTHAISGIFAFGAWLGASKSGTAGDGPAGTKIITAPQYSKTFAPELTGSAEAHNNLPQTLFQWILFKL